MFRKQRLSFLLTRLLSLMSLVSLASLAVSLLFVTATKAATTGVDDGGNFNYFVFDEEGLFGFEAQLTLFEGLTYGTWPKSSFEVGQTVDEDIPMSLMDPDTLRTLNSRKTLDKSSLLIESDYMDFQDPMGAPKPHSRIYTLLLKEPTSLDGNNCTLNFNNPFGSSAKIHRYGNATITVRAFPHLIYSTLKWSVIHSLIADSDVLARFGGAEDELWNQNAFDRFVKVICEYENRLGFYQAAQAFVFSIDEGVQETAYFRSNQRLMKTSNLFWLNSTGVST